MIKCNKIWLKVNTKSKATERESHLNWFWNVYEMSFFNRLISNLEKRYINHHSHKISIFRSFLYIKLCTFNGSYKAIFYFEIFGTFCHFRPSLLFCTIIVIQTIVLRMYSPTLTKLLFSCQKNWNVLCFLVGLVPISFRCLPSKTLIL